MSIHEDVYYSCEQCDHKTINKSCLQKQVESKHEGVYILVINVIVKQQIGAALRNMLDQSIKELCILGIRVSIKQLYID